MTDPSSDFLTANQSRARSLRRSLQPRRGDQSLIALGEAGDVSIEFARYRSTPKTKKGVWVQQFMPHRRVHGCREMRSRRQAEWPTTPLVRQFRPELFSP